MYAGFDVVSIQVNEERRIVGPSPHSRITVVPGSTLQANGMESVHRFARRSAKGNVRWAVSCQIQGTPERRTPGRDHEERSLGSSASKHKPSSSIRLRMIFQQAEADLFKDAAIEGTTGFEISEHYSDMIEHLNSVFLTIAR